MNAISNLALTVFPTPDECAALFSSCAKSDLAARGHEGTVHQHSNVWNNSLLSERNI